MRKKQVGFAQQMKPSVKLHDGNGEGVLFIDDAVEIVSVKLTDRSGVYPYPVNKTHSKIAIRKSLQRRQNIGRRWGLVPRNKTIKQYSCSRNGKVLTPTEVKSISAI